jgi:acetyl-CoA carboxylase biotin carboxyl carrier protein
MANEKQHISGNITLDEIRELIALIKGSDITELAIERGDARFQIKRGSTAPAPVVIQGSMPHMVQTMAHPMAVAESATGAVAESEPVVSGHAVTSPMVGTYYASPSPKDAAFVNEGDMVKVGDQLCIVEAMKMMNGIESEVAGRVIKILVKNGEPVEFGQTLMIIEPSNG